MNWRRKLLPFYHFIAVNNVGVSTDLPNKFGEISEKGIWSNINVNVATVPAMTSLVLSGMLDRRKGAIINMSSITDTYPHQMLGLYSASKVRNTSFILT